MMQHKYYANGKLLAAPVLPAFEFVKIDYGPVWLVWCRSCEIIHMHGPKEGHRAAHCVSESSIFNKSGYVLKYSGKVKNRNEVRPGKAFLQGFNALGRRAATEMRLTLLQSWFPEGSHFSRLSYEAGRFTAEVGCNSAVSLDLDTMDWEYYDYENQLSKPIISKGQGLDTLANKLFGLPCEEVRRRIGSLVCGRSAENPPADQISASSFNSEADDHDK